MRKIFSLAAGILLAACANSSLIDNGVVKIETESPTPINFTYVQAYREDGQLVIKGGLEILPPARYRRFTGHVEISVITPDGTTIERDDIEPKGRRRPKVIGRKATFIARFAIDTRPGTIVHIAYSKENHNGKS
jgi:hypothetical protein